MSLVHCPICFPETVVSRMIDPTNEVLRPDEGSWIVDNSTDTQGWARDAVFNFDRGLVKRDEDR